VASAGATGSAAFVRALRRGGSLAQAGVHLEAVRREARQGLEAAVRLDGYRRYLARARAHKASARRDAASTAAFEREVLAQGRASVSDAYALSRSALAVTRQLWSVGALDERLAATREAAASTGAVEVLELWERMTTPAAREALRAAGFSDQLQETTDGIVRSLRARLSAEGPRLVVTATADGRALTGSVATVRAARPATAGELLSRGRFEELVAAVEGGEPAFLDGVSLDSRAGAPGEDLALLGALGVWREGVRHVRKLEDSGLATYAGGDPVTTIIVIGAIGLAALIASAILSAFCDEEEDPDSTACIAKDVLFVIAFIGLSIFGAVTGKDQAPPSINNRLLSGSLLQRGVLADLGELRA
jgi:hypothetical protein